MSAIGLAALVLPGLNGGFTAVTVRTAAVDAPITDPGMRPLMLEGRLCEVVPGAKGNRLPFR